LIRLNISLRIDVAFIDEDKFIVSYQRNSHFKDRIELLTKLHDKLCEILSDQYNHRVAFHELADVGKTQLALEYVYTQWNKKTYEQVYWISAVSQATLFIDLQEIGFRNRFVFSNTDLKSSNVATMMLR